jgi:hypothetical protein
VEVEMDKNNYFAEKLEQERAVEEILLSQRDPVSKVQQIMKLGLEEEEANELVSRYQIGQMSPVYYERLNFEDEDDLLT